MDKTAAVATTDPMAVPEAAKLLGKSKMTLYRWIESGRILTIEFGGKTFIPLSEVERLKKEVGVAD